MPFIGKQSTSNSQITNYTTTVGSGGQTNFTVVIEGGDETHVYLNGVLLKETTDYTVSSTQVSLVSPAVENDIVEIKVFRSFALVDAVKATGGTFSGNVAVNGDLTVDTDTLKVDSSGGHIGIGTASPTTFSGYKTLHLKNASGDTAFLNETDGGVIHEILTSDSNSCAFTGTRSAHALKFRTNQYERMSIASSANDTADVTVTKGNLVIGTAGQGITFGGDPDSRISSGTTAGNRTLYDYEEGTWTGKIRYGSSSGTSNGSATGYYTKIGRNVSISIQISLATSTSGSGQVYLTGLPFTSDSGFNYAGSLMVNDFMDASRVSARVAGGHAYAVFYIHPNSHSTGLASWTTSHIHSGTTGKAIGMTVTYPSA